MEYAVAWDLLSSATEPPRGGDELAGIWMVHWSYATGRIWKGHIMEGRSSGHSRTSSPALTKLGPHDLPQNLQPDIAAIAEGITWGDSRLVELKTITGVSTIDFSDYSVSRPPQDLIVMPSTNWRYYTGTIAVGTINYN